ncbi:MAG: stage 0 sporulation family protein [Lachnospiraceae bacterium]|nr:stage 0 sporulation family protein [Lachnospiraceae bacterium]
MQKVSVGLRHPGKHHYYAANGLELNRNMKVIVETARGLEMGTVLAVYETEETDLKPVLRIATAADLEQDGKNRVLEARAFQIGREKIAKHKLLMKLVSVEYTFDGGKILFYFTADNRVDFRELVKDLASVFHTRIELRQIGVRDETKLLGGVGVCGRELCCHSYLSEFQTVSIRMAKEQNLSLNPTKISGICGRLMCCLNNEQATYEYLNGKLPQVGERVTVREEGTKGVVQSVNVLRQTVKVLINPDGDDSDVAEYPAEELLFSQRHRKGRVKLSEEELEEARALEALEGRDGAGAKSSVES